MFAFIADVIWWAWLFWSWTYVWWLMFSRNKQAKAYRFLAETKQAFKGLIVLKMAISDVETFVLEGLGVYWLPIVWCSDLLWFIFIRDIDDDDRWKKRRKKAAAKVKEVAGRLVVVPELAPVTGK